jgi:hypothetical protein
MRKESERKETHMKVGILTYHNTINYGATLQTYASQRILTRLGADCEIIDYVNSHRARMYSIPKLAMSELSKGRPKTSIRMMLGWYLVGRRKKKINLFAKKKLAKSCAYRSHADILAHPPVYDRYIVGSDQVWNYEHNGHDTTYFLDFVKDKNKTASYASSFGLASIDLDKQAIYKEALSAIKWLAVREDTGQRIVYDLIGRKARLVLDPVFLLDIEAWKELSDKNFPCRRKYVLVYTTEKFVVKKFVETTQYDLSQYVIAKISRSTSIVDFINPSVSIKYAVTPEEFLSLIQNASLVLTSSFHCTALSIIFQKQFVSFLSDDKGKNTRIESLLDQLNLSDRIYTPDLRVGEINLPIDYIQVNEKLDILKTNSIDYLKQVLSENSDSAEQ